MAPTLQPGSGVPTLISRLGHRALQTVGGNLPFGFGDIGDTDSGAWWSLGAILHTLRLVLIYLDTGTEDIQALWYNSTGTLQTTTIVTKGNTGIWQVAAVTLANARTGFGYFREYGNADLLLTCTGELIITRLMARDTARNMRVAWSGDPDTALDALDAPDIDDFTNAAHDHSNAAGGTKLAQANTHESPDTDAATTSLHHTIGATATTAAAGNHTHAGSGLLQLTIVSPAAITGNVNDYNPGSGGLFRLSADAAHLITGWTATATCTAICIYNISNFALTLKHENVNSAAANRFFFSTGTDIVIAAGSFAWVIYDTDSTRWRDC